MYLHYFIITYTYARHVYTNFIIYHRYDNNVINVFNRKEKHRMRIKNDRVAAWRLNIYTHKYIYNNRCTFKCLLSLFRKVMNFLKIFNIITSCHAIMAKPTLIMKTIYIPFNFYLYHFLRFFIF